jgi:hypothetical protein
MPKPSKPSPSKALPCTCSLGYGVCRVHPNLSAFKAYSPAHSLRWLGVVLEW